MKISIYFKYILRELIQPFIFGIAAFTAIFVGTDVIFQLTDLYTQFDISLLRLGELFLLSLPQIIVYTFPMGSLLATILAYSRLNGDGEITAFRAGGFSIRKLLVPALIMGLVVSLGAIAINEYVVPQANYRYSLLEHEFEHGEQRPRTQYDLFLTPLDSSTNRPDFILYTRRFDADEGEMESVVLQEFNGGRPTTLIEAERAIWEQDNWHFYDGHLFRLARDERVPQMSFSEYIVRTAIDEPEEIARLDRDVDEMNMRELGHYITRLRAEGQEAFEERVLWHQQLSIPFASFIFVLLAAPLGLKPRREGGSATGMGLSVIIIFIYYGVMTLGDALGSQGTIPPWLGAWGQNIIFLLAGMVLLYRLGE